MSSSKKEMVMDIEAMKVEVEKAKVEQDALCKKVYSKVKSGTWKIVK